MTLEADQTGDRPRRGPLAALVAIDDGALIRAAFYLLLAGTAGVLYLDYRELDEDAAASLAAPDMPVLPPFDPDAPGGGRAPAVTTDQALLRNPLTVTLRPGGVLELVGTFDVGAAGRFAAEVEARGEYVTTVRLDSPGGSVGDALEMGALIRDAGFSTEVADGALCASSCPLVFAAGTERIAGPDAAIGVHQIYAAALTGDATNALRAAGVAMADAQATTAQITRYLTGMEVEPALWLHALETPPNRLYYFSPEELLDLKLATTLKD